MKFISSELEIGDMAAGISNLISSGRYDQDQLLLVCSEEHKSDCESMVEIDVETVNAENLTDRKRHFLKELQIEEDGMDLYEDVIRRGGYILLEKDHSTGSLSDSADISDRPADTPESDKSDKPDKSPTEDISLQGYAVDFNANKTDANTHEDVIFDPDDSNPDKPRR